MSEQELLHQILSGAVIVDNVRAWLDISYTVRKYILPQASSVLSAGGQ